MDEVIQTVPKNEQPFAGNTPILLKRYSDGTKFVFVDKTQGKVFKRAEQTKFEGDEEKEALAVQIQEQLDKQKAQEAAEKKAKVEFIWEQNKRRMEAETKKQETDASRTNDKIDASIRAVDNISDGIKTHGL
ncbi:hypothetical protein [Vibrio harveyi]|uniref:hypothetical protein n=1 Tax=Vibrio harveyi TaxID=669 RepID=UPI003D764E3D